MAFNDKGAYWLSNISKIKNPYYGKKMLTCGEVAQELRYK
jgi:Cu(I)/Ag(I) efflux system membrane fusion protein